MRSYHDLVFQEVCVNYAALTATNYCVDGIYTLMGGGGRSFLLLVWPS